MAGFSDYYSWLELRLLVELVGFAGAGLAEFAGTGLALRVV